MSAALEHAVALAQADKAAWQAYREVRDGAEHAPHVAPDEVLALCTAWLRATDATAVAVEALTTEERAAFMRDPRTGAL